MMNRLSDIPITTEYVHSEKQSCQEFEDIFGLAYQSASIGYYFRDKKDHMSTTAIWNEEIGEIQSDSRGKEPVGTVVL